MRWRTIPEPGGLGNKAYGMVIPSRADKIGYARVRTPDQKLDAQFDALQQEGCGQMFADQVSGTTDDRPGWERLLAYGRPGDTVIVTELSRMTRSLGHWLDVMALFERRTMALIS
jgi:DNA invertase Pin-like site-specific DNA recombinase